MNSRLGTIQAAVLLAKVEDFGWEFNKRNELADNYNKSLSG